MAFEAMKVRFFQSGFCTSHSKVIDPRTKFKKIKFAAIWALIDLPSGGYAMFDTGYAKHFLTATERFPDRLYRWITPIELNEEETAIAILGKEGIDASQIKWIVISHFHADHIAGIKDFPNAQFLCSEAALNEVLSLRGIAAVKKGLLGGLFPMDFQRRVNTFETVSSQSWINNHGTTCFKWDLTPNITWMLLPGHARGMIGFEFLKNEKPILFATDAAWSHDAFKDAILPWPIVKVFIDSMAELGTTWAALHRWQQENPQGEIYFTHCPKTQVLLRHE